MLAGAKAQAATKQKPSTTGIFLAIKNRGQALYYACPIIHRYNV
jgi:hypothetical protein